MTSRHTHIHQKAAMASTPGRQMPNSSMHNLQQPQSATHVVHFSTAHKQPHLTENPAGLGSNPAARLSIERLSDGAPDTPPYQQQKHQLQQQQQQHQNKHCVLPARQHHMPQRMAADDAQLVPIQQGNADDPAACQVPKTLHLTSQGELMLAHLHCRYAENWEAIAQHIPSHTPAMLADLWRCAVQRQALAPQRWLSDYIQQLKHGQPAPAAFAAVVQRLPACVKSDLLDSAATRQEFRQASIALATAADADAIQALINAVKAGRVVPVQYTSRDTTVAAAACQAVARPPPAVQEALNHSAAQVIAAAENLRQTGTAAAGVAAGQRGVGAMKGGGSSTSVLPAAGSNDGPLTGVPHAPSGHVDSAGIAEAKHAAMAYHMGRSARLGGVHQEGSLQQQNLQHKQQQLLLHQQHILRLRNEQQCMQAPRPLAGNKRPLETDPQQGLLQQQQHQQQQQQSESSRQPQVSFEKLAADLIVEVRDRTVPAAAAATMLLQVTQQQLAQQEVADTAAAEPGKHRTPASMQAADSGMSLLAGPSDWPAAATTNLQQQPAPSASALHMAQSRELDRLRQQTQEVLSMQPLIQTQHTQRLRVLRQQQQQISPQADLWGLPGGVDQVDDPAALLQQISDPTAFLQQINGLEVAVRSLAGRKTSPAADSLQQPQHQQEQVQQRQPQKQARLEYLPGITSAAGGTASDVQRVQQQRVEQQRPQMQAIDSQVPFGASQPAATAQKHPPAADRESRLQTIKQMLQQLPDRARIVQQIKAESTVDLDAYFSGAEASSDPDHAGSSTPVHPALAQAAKQNDMALLTDAAEAVLNGREPRVRAATLSRYGGTTRVTSAADLVSNPFGKQVLAALQKLLLVPGARGELPPGAQIIVEVAMPQSAGATPAAAAASAGGASAAAASSGSLFGVSADAAVASNGAVGAAAPEQVPQGAAQQETLHIDLTEADADDDTQAETAGEAHAHVPSRSATPAAADSAAYAAAGARGRMMGMGTLADAVPAVPTAAAAVEGVGQGKAQTGAAAGAMMADAHAEFSARPATLPGAPYEAEYGAVCADGKRGREQEQLNEPQATCPLAPPAKRTYRAELYL